MKHTLTFYEEGHAYAIDGQDVPSVTEVLGELLPGHQADPYYLQRGQAVHAGAAIIIRGESLAEDPDPRIAGQLEAVRLFQREWKPEPVAVEMRVCSVRHMYAGTLDLVANIKGATAIFDWKASIEAAVRYQLAAYAWAYAETTGAAIPRHGYVVQLKEDGNYVVQGPFDMRVLSSKWFAMLTTYRIRLEHGMVKQKEHGQ